MFKIIKYCDSELKFVIVALIFFIKPSLAFTNQTIHSSNVISTAYLSLVPAELSEQSLVSLQFQQKQANRWTNLARWAPRIDLQVSQGKNKDSTMLENSAFASLPFALTPSESNYAKWNLIANFPIYKKSIHLNVQTSIIESQTFELKENLKKSEKNWRILQLYSNTVIQFFRKIAIQNQLHIAEQNIKDIQIKFSLGQKTKIDTLKAESHLALVRAKQFTLEKDFDSSIFELEEYLGRKANETSIRDIFKSEEFIKLSNDEKLLMKQIVDFSPIDQEFEFFKKTLSLSENSPSHFSRQNTELNNKIDDLITKSSKIKLIQKESELLEKQAEMSLANEWPELTTYFSLNKSSPTWDQAFNSTQQNYNIGITLNIPIFSGGSFFSSYQEMDKGRLANKIKLERNLIQAKNEVLQLSSQINYLNQALKAQEIAMIQLEEIAKLSQKSFELGRTTTSELLATQNEWIEAKISYAQTRLQLMTLFRQIDWLLSTN